MWDFFKFFIILPVLIIFSCSHITEPLGTDFITAKDINGVIVWGAIDLVEQGQYPSKWTVSDDIPNQGNSTNHQVSFAGVPSFLYEDGEWGALSTNAIRLDYVLGDNAYPYPYVNIGVGDSWNVYDPSRDLFLDASKYAGFSFWLKGNGKKLRVKVCTIDNFKGTSADVGNGSLYDWDFYGFDIEKTPSEWTRYIIPFTALKREGWSSTPVSLQLDHITRFEFQASSQIKKEQGWFMIYKLELIEGIYVK